VKLRWQASQNLIVNRKGMFQKIVQKRKIPAKAKVDVVVVAVVVVVEVVEETVVVEMLAVVVGEISAEIAFIFWHAWSQG
jgi:hypothetical protein